MTNNYTIIPEVISKSRKTVLDRVIKRYMDRYVKEVFGKDYNPTECIYITQNVTRHLSSMLLTSAMYLDNQTPTSVFKHLMDELLLKHGMSIVINEDVPKSIIIN